MAQPQLMQIKLSRFDAQPWGFRLQGGVDFAAPLLVQKVNGGSLAEQAGLLPGDAVLKINDVDVFNLRHKDAQDIVVRSGNNFVVTVQRGGSTWRPHVTPTGHVPQPNQNSPYLQTVTKTSLAHKQQESQHIGCGYNNAARPFVNGGDGSVKSIVNKQYNTPVGIYSDESIAETLSAQAEVLAGGVLGVNFKKNEKEYQADKSEVLKFLREEETGQSTPVFNNHQYQEPQQQQTPPQHYQQPPPPQQQQHYNQPSATRHVSAPINTPKPPSTGGLPTGQNICNDCERLITGVFVRIKDKNLHVECFKCATCGTSLKNQGYYNFNNKLYCDIHAKLAAMQNPPAGTEGYVPVPIKPNTKLSATTISSALNAHGFNGVSNGSSTPTPAPAPAPVANPLATTAANTVAQAPIAEIIKQDNTTANMAATFENNDQSIYGQINTNAANIAQPSFSASGDQPFEYVTLTGNVIRSVVPPGKGGSINYKVNQGYARPFGAAPPSAAPKSPISYPPQPQQWASPPQQQAPKPASNPYATLPRSNVGQQDIQESLQPQYAEEYCEIEQEIVLAERKTLTNLVWPPPQDDSHNLPTAAPLYIAPPETQHVVTKPLEQPPPVPPGSVGEKSQPSMTESKTELTEAQQQQQQQQQQLYWQSRSAPQLTSQIQTHELESSSDSYTSTSTTTTTTSEEYQRMYAAQVQAYQMQQAYEQSGSELDYHMDLEVAAMQQKQCCLTASEHMSGRRSAQECVVSLAAPLSTYKLVDLVREVTPSPIPPPSTQVPRHVVFVDEPEIKELEPILEYESIEKVQKKIELESQSLREDLQKVEEMEPADYSTTIIENEKDELVISNRNQILESERIFQPTPEIKIEIAPVRQIPPTKIPNPTPKQWINPMVRALTTAPEVPFHLTECLCPKPCDCSFEIQTKTDDQSHGNTVSPPKTPPISKVEERPPSPKLAEPSILQESPLQGSYLTNAISIAPEFSINLAPTVPQPISLPEETEPYMPPPIDLKPYMREDYRPKSPFLSALTVAPEKSFEGQFERDVPIHVIDLPTPKEHLTMSDALRIAPQRSYTPLNPENATHMFEEQEKKKEKKKYEFQVLDNDLESDPNYNNGENVQYYTTDKQERGQRKSSAFAAMQAFQPSREPLTPSTPRNSIISLSQNETDLDYANYCKAKERNEKRLNYLHKLEENLQQTEPISTQSNTCKESLISSCTKATSSTNSSSTVQQLSTTYASNTTQASQSAYATHYGSHALSSGRFDEQELIAETVEELEHSDVLFPPPSPLSHLKNKPVSSGLHKADTIPKYQRNWTVLPTQSPVRTPEPQELRENVPLAFVEAPKVTSAEEITTNRLVNSTVTTQTYSSSNRQQQTVAAASVVSSSEHTGSEQRQQQPSAQALVTPQQKLPIVPIIIEDRSGPVTMAFQSLDEHLEPPLSNRAYTPSLTNKPAPIIPFYQTPEKLCFDECAATHAKPYDRRSASPFPDRARSPAPGPPPNPLSNIRAPRIKDANVPARMLQVGSITTGQSYLGAQQAQQQGQLLSHFETTSQAGSQSYTEKPETVMERKIGDTTIQKREKESRLEEQKQSQLQSQTTTQIGNTQIERRRKVTEEFEHTQSAKTVEIRTGSQSSSEHRQTYGKTGFVANQARRLSGLEQEITDLTSQSQAISARAALMDTSFPQLSSLETTTRFPTKSPVPYDEPKSSKSTLATRGSENLVGPPPGFQTQQQKELSQMTNAYGSSLISLQQKQHQQQQQQQQKSLSAFNSVSTISSNSSLQANTVSSSLTKASATNTQAFSASKTGGTSASSGICPVTGTFCRPGHSCCKQQLIQSQPTAAAAPSAANNSNNLSLNNTYRPNASAGMTGFKPPQASAATSALAAEPSAIKSAPMASAAAPSISESTNVGDSSGLGGKGGAYGATSAPKRGRGIMNKAVAPGVRVPLCNSCHIQIRGPFITALGRIWCPEHFICVNANCRRPLQDIGFVEEKGDLYCEYCFEKYLAPTCSKCCTKIKGDCLNAIGKHFHPECFTCGHCGKLFGNTPFFLEDGNAYCEADWNELFTTKCFACGFPVEAGDRWVEALNHNYHSQCFNCSYCKQNLEGQSFYNKGGRPFCKNHAR
ncbi:PDZ and LIM domain protein Zasp isoform X2 [Teleopsis dalmanni]|uniref:PDZ and LIM domain protein Zasp isoform X2 n=1 Tax=Teleopsis dalmanni TaxID=139649 RepID=UPI0018CD4041|nr:PDZ and LIM domain protein Zasp isoform X2 [Teleopsis dalmanni]